MIPTSKLAAVFFTLLALASPLDAASVRSKRFLEVATHEARSAVPVGWAARTDSSGLGKRGDKPVLDKKSFTVPVRIHLAQRNLHRAEDLLMDVADPASPNYGKHWSANDVMEMFSPSEESIKSVLEWLEDAGFSGKRKGRYVKSKGSVVVNMSLAEAEDLLNAKYELYDHPSSPVPHIACTKYDVPASIKHHIDFVTPTVHFDVPLGHRGAQHDASKRIKVEAADLSKRTDDVVTNGTAKGLGKPNEQGSYPVNLQTTGVLQDLSGIFTQLTNCDTHITPICLEALYKFSPKVQFASKKNSYGIVEYTPQSYVPSDLDVFAKNFTPAAVGYRPTLASIDGGALVGGTPNFNTNGESNLDLTFGIALTYPTPITLYQTGDAVEGASFNNFLDAIDGSYCTYEGGDDPTQDGIYPDPYGGYQGKEDCGTFKPTNVISTSYAYNEADLTPFYENRQCNEYMKLGLQGVTVLYSSGDYGVAGNSGQCIDPTTGEYGTGGTANYIRFNPSFPGTCPWITSVGATQVNPNSTVLAAESACEQVIYSGGGFSNVFPMPGYQKSAVASYFKNHKPSYTATQYNNSQITRGFPDISANGANYVVPIGGTWYRVFGTSASSPVVGAIVTLLNDARIALGKTPLGFLNPALYSNSYILNDITSGGNQGCGTPGFTAVKGWDPVTGLGTPNFPLMTAVLNLL
ncbi:subtilisin-like protein [Clavulina sp. PMI_390]|nr:subtilisin-like protein [Clavulina sp. PMI_390]